MAAITVTDPGPLPTSLADEERDVVSRAAASLMALTLLAGACIAFALSYQIVLVEKWGSVTMSLSSQHGIHSGDIVGLVIATCGLAFTAAAAALLIQSTEPAAAPATAR
jgi:hypothetical protein